MYNFYFSPKESVISEGERRSRIENELRQHVECEERAFRIVGRLIENPITEEFLMDAVS